MSVLKNLNFLDEKESQRLLSDLTSNLQKKEYENLALLNSFLKALETPLELSKHSKIALIQVISKISKGISQEMTEKVLKTLLKYAEELFIRDYHKDLTLFLETKPSKKLSKIFNGFEKEILTGLKKESKYLQFLIVSSIIIQKKKDLNDIIYEGYSGLLKSQIQVKDYKILSKFYEKLNEKEIQELLTIYLDNLKRNFDTLFLSLLNLIEFTKVDTKIFEPIFKIVLPFVFENEKVIEFCYLISSKTKDSKIIEELFQQISEISVGTSSNEKISCLKAIKAISNSQFKQELKDFTEKKVYPFLESIFISKTVPEIVRMESIEVLTKWILDLGFYYQSFETQVTSIVESEKSGNLVSRIMKCLGDLSENKEFIKPILKLLNRIISMITLSEKKLTDRGLAILCLRCLMKTSIYSDSILDQLNQVLEKTILNEENGYLISLDNLTRLNEIELISFIEFIELLLINHYDKIDSERDLNLFVFMIGILSSKYLSVRMKMKESIQKIVTKQQEMYSNLLNGFIEFLKNSTGYDYKLVGESLLSILPKPDYDLELFKKFFFFLHHPLIEPFHIFSIYYHQNKSIQEILNKNLVDVYEYLIDGNDTNYKKLSCANCLSSIINIIGDTGSEYILKRLNDELFKILNELKEFNQIDYKIYFTKDGEVYRDISKEIYHPNSFDKDKIISKREKLEMKYSLTFEEWQELFEEEKNMKKKDENRNDLLKKYYMKKEAIIREKIQELVDKVEYYFLCISTISKKSNINSNLSFISIIISKYLSHPILYQQSFETFESLLKNFYRDLAHTTALATFRLIGKELDRSRNQYDDDTSFFEHLITKLRLLTLNMNDIEKFSLIYPFLSFILKDSNVSISSKTISLNIISSHSGLMIRSSLFRTDLLNTLIKVLEYYPTMNKQVSHSMIQSGSLLKSEDIEPLQKGLYHLNSNIRNTCLSTLLEFSKTKSHLIETKYLNYYLFLSKNDSNPENSKIASKIYEKLNKEIDKEFDKIYFPLLGNSELFVRNIASISIEKSIELYPDLLDSILNQLYQLYESNQVPWGLKSYKDFEIENQTRFGVANCLLKLSKFIGKNQIDKFYEFLVFNGLYDISIPIKEEFQNCGIEMIYHKGKELTDLLYKILEDYLSKGNKESEEDDYVISSLVIFLGAVAKNLSNQDKKLKNVLKRLLESLYVKSNSVQKAVSNVLAPIISKFDDQTIQETLDSLFLNLTTNLLLDKQGAAFGLSGCIYGLGIGSIKKFKIVENLEQYANNKSSKNEREGSMIAYDSIISKLGVLFEPYYKIILPDILLGFSDLNEEVRSAANHAAKTMMSNISEHGVRIILPGILDGLKDNQWRTKKGSVQLCGAMAFLAPRQLSSCLPIVVEKLKSALSDTHPEVSNEAMSALQRVGGVVLNPEISSQVPLLLKAINDPDQTETALDNLLHTRFIHSVDPASLALLIPVILRGLKGYHVDTKKKSAVIVGNMTSLVANEEVLVPYIPILMPILKIILSDANPDVRAATAKAIGVLATSVKTKTTEILPWLIENIQKESSVTERCGAAQALSELLTSQKTNDLFESLLPEFLDGLSNGKSSVRHGFLQIFIYLPALMKQRFQPFLSTCLPKVLEGLSDDDEYVRESAIQSCKIIVNLFATTAQDLLLPSLVEGLSADSPRTRQCCLVILTDFLDRVADSIDNENKKKDISEETLIDTDLLKKALGEDQVNDIIAQVFLLQYDLNPNVQSEAMNLWKSMVSNTTRTCRSIMKSLIHLLIQNLALDSEDHRQMAAKALGEFVKRLGHRVLGELIPLLDEGLASDKVETRQGSCLGLTELMLSSPKHAPLFSNQLIPFVKKALCDLDEDVQESASSCFDALSKTLGSNVVETISESILSDMLKGSLESLNGLKQIVKVRPQYVLPKLIPLLTKSPVSEINAKALAAITPVCGSYLGSYIVQILQVLIKEVNGEKTSQYIQTSILSTINSVTQDTLSVFISSMLKFLIDNDSVIRCGAVYTIQIFFENHKLDILSEMPLILEVILRFYIDPLKEAVQAGQKAIHALFNSIDKDQIGEFIPKVREVLKGLTEDEKGKKVIQLLPGFNLFDGISPFVYLFTQGLLSTKSTNDVKEQTALCIGELIELTDQEILKKHVIKLTGPLIRVIGERNPWQVKAAILSTFNLLLLKGGIQIRPFLPQLQTTFIKLLSETNKVIPKLSAEALGKLVPLGAKVDTLLNELHTNLKNALKTDSINTINAYASAIQSVIIAAKPKKQIVEPFIETFLSILKLKDDELKENIAIKIGSIAPFLEDKFDSFISTILSSNEPVYILIIGSLAKYNSNTKINESLEKFLVSQLKNDNISTRRYVLKSCNSLLKRNLSISLIETILKFVEIEKTGELKFEGVRVIKNVSKKQPGDSKLFICVNPLLKFVKDKNTSLRGITCRALVHLLDLETGKFGFEEFSKDMEESEKSKLEELVQKLIDNYEQSEEEKDEF